MNINELNTTDSIADDDLFPIWDASASATRKVTAKQIAEYVEPPAVDAGSRRKYEAYWTGLVLELNADTEYNLVSLLKAITPSVGVGMASTPFINTTTNKVAVYNENKTCFIKLTVEGVFSGGSSNRGLTMTLGLAVPDTITYNRPVTSPADRFTFLQMISVDAGGFAALNGFTLKIEPELGNYTATTVKLIVEQ